MYKKAISVVLCLSIILTFAINGNNINVLWAKTYELHARHLNYLGVTAEDESVYLTTPAASSNPAYFLVIDDEGYIKTNISLGTAEPGIMARDKNDLLYFFKHSSFFFPFLYAMDSSGKIVRNWDLTDVISSYFNLQITKAGTFYLKGNVSKVGVTTLQHTIVKIDKETLKPQWSIVLNKTTLEAYDTFPVLIFQLENITFFVYDFNIYAVNAHNGNILWHNTLNIEIYSACALPDNRIAIVTENDYERVTIYVFNNNGNELWHYKIKPCYSSQRIVSVDFKETKLGVTRYDFESFSNNKYEYDVFDINNGSFIGNFTINKEYNSVNQIHFGKLYDTIGYYANSIYEISSKIVLHIEKIEFGKKNIAETSPVNYESRLVSVCISLFFIIKLRKLKRKNR